MNFWKQVILYSLEHLIVKWLTLILFCVFGKELIQIRSQCNFFSKEKDLNLFNLVSK